MGKTSILPFALSTLASLVLAACGGTAIGIPDAQPSNDGSAEGSAEGGGTCNIHPEADGGCLGVTPTEGSCCKPGQSICVPPGTDSCCVGYVWTCDSSSNTWTKAGLGCACLSDGGGPDVIAETGPDSPPVDSGPTACGPKLVCNPGDVCLITHTSGGACGAPDDAGACPPDEKLVSGCCILETTSYSCKPMPAACKGGISCSCDPWCDTSTGTCSTSGSTLTCNFMGA